jgi:hypothetical protein
MLHPKYWLSDVSATRTAQVTGTRRILRYTVHTTRTTTVLQLYGLWLLSPSLQICPAHSVSTTLVLRYRYRTSTIYSTGTVRYRTVPYGTCTTGTRSRSSSYRYRTGTSSYRYYL